MVMVAVAGLSLWCGFRWGASQERRQWFNLIEIGELPKPGQKWVPQADPASSTNSESVSR